MFSVIFSEKLNRFRNQWSVNIPQWNSSPNVHGYNFNRVNVTDLKVILNTPYISNKIRSKDRQTSVFSYQPESLPAEYSLDSDMISVNSNQKITKQYENCVIHLRYCN